jgi:FdhE protein
MQRTNAGVRRDPRPSRLKELAGQNAEWRSWLNMLELLEVELRAGNWNAAVEPLSTSHAPTLPRSHAHAFDAPLLHAAAIPVSRTVAERWLDRLLSAAETNAQDGGVFAAARDVDALELLAAGITYDYRRPARLATISDDDIVPLAATLSLAVIPLLHACAAQMSERVPANWLHGYCPLCGAWPTLTEVRGLERARVLRCGRCGGGWQTAALLCPFCGERDHHRLASLIPDADNPVQHVEVCTTCNGYIKVFTVLQAISAAELVLEDLATVELDLVAMQRGRARPPDPGYRMDVHVVEEARRVRSFFGVSS